MKKKIFFLFNPIAGKGMIKNNLVEVLNVFTANGYEVTIHPTQNAEDAFLTISALEPVYDAVVCSGGDGTLEQVVSGLVAGGLAKKIPLGYLPAGSTNDLGNSLHIPNQPVDAAKIIVMDRKIWIDAGQVNHGDTFVYVMAFGWFTEVSYDTPQDLKNVFGHAAYVFRSIQSLSNLKSYHMHIETTDGSSVFSVDGDFAYGMITNTRNVAGIQPFMNEKADISDGILEVTLIRTPTTPLDLNNILIAFTNQELDSRYMIHFSSRYLKIESDTPVAWTRDGEFGGSLTSTEIECLQHAYQIFVPESEE